MAEKPEKRHPLILRAFIETWEEMSVPEIVGEIVVGIGLTYLGIYLHIIQHSELAELLFLTAIGAVACPVVIFLIRLIFVTPWMLCKATEKELNEANSKLKSKCEIENKKHDLAFCLQSLQWHLEEIQKMGVVVDADSLKNRTYELIHGLPLEYDQMMRVDAAEPTPDIYSYFDLIWHSERVRAKMAEIRQMIIELN